MPIRVTCNKCHTRFDVSDKFAGKEGPCPKCKTQIRVPEKTDEIVIHAPTEGPKDSKGRPVLKPIGRKETILSSVQITLIAVCIIGFLVGALVLRMMMEGDLSKFPSWLLFVAAIGIAPPVVYSAYTFLRNQELGAFVGRELWNRVLICSCVYAVLWFAVYLGAIAFNDKYELGTWLTAFIPMIGIGAGAAMLLFDIEYLMGMVHYGMYLGICLIGRWIAGIGVLPGMLYEGKPSPFDVPDAATTLLIENVGHVLPGLVQTFPW